MTDLKKQLEAVRDLMALDFCKVKEEGLNNLGQMKYSSEELHNLETRQMKQPAFQAGFSAAIPIILKAVEQRDEADMLYARQVVPDQMIDKEIALAKKRQNQELLKKFVDKK